LQPVAIFLRGRL